MRRVLYPAIPIASLDGKEMSIFTATRGPLANYPCSRCLVRGDQLHDIFTRHRTFELRTTESMKAVYEEAAAMQYKTHAEEHLQSYGLYSTEVFSIALPPTGQLLTSYRTPFGPSTTQTPTKAPRTRYYTRMMRGNSGRKLGHAYRRSSQRWETREYSLQSISSSILIHISYSYAVFQYAPRAAMARTEAFRHCYNQGYQRWSKLLRYREGQSLTAISYHAKFPIVCSPMCRSVTSKEFTIYPRDPCTCQLPNADEFTLYFGGSDSAERGVPDGVREMVHGKSYLFRSCSASE